MKRLKSLLIGFSVLLLLIQTIPIQAMPLVEYDKKTSLELHYRYGEQALGNMNAKVYKVGNISSEGEYVLTEEFEALIDGEVKLESASDWYNVAKVLARYVRDNPIKEISKIKSNANGKVVVDNLTTGLYLILTEKRMMDDLEICIAPTLIALPHFSVDAQEWVYDRVAYPKSEEKEPGDSDFEIEDEELPGGSSKLPQTGMPMKPVIYMAIIGVILFTAGWIDYQRK